MCGSRCVGEGTAIRYLDAPSLSLTTDPALVTATLDLQYDTDQLPDAFSPGDQLLTSVWGADRWKWLPKWVEVIIEPDGVKLEREDPLTYALKQRNLSLTYRSKPPTERSKRYAEYLDAVAWAESLSGQSRIEVGEATAGSAPYRLVTDPSDAAGILKSLRGREYALDYETTSLNPREARIVGVALADEHMAWYIAGAGLAALPELRALILDPNSQAVCWNSKYEYAVSACQLGIEPTSIPLPFIDPMVGRHILTSENRNNGLKAVTRELNPHKSVLEFEDVVPKGTSIEDVPLDLLARYAAAGDARGTYDNKLVLWDRLRDQSLLHIYEKFEWQLTPVLAEMELAGMLIDQNALAALIPTYQQQLIDLDAVIKAMGFAGNPNSPEEVAHWLYDDLGLPVFAKSDKTGRGSVRTDVLRRLVGLHPAPEMLLERSKAYKLLNTFLLKAQGVEHIYVSFNQTSTGTGRLSSSGNGHTEPKRVNSQNWPLVVRDIVVPPMGEVIFGRDYNQIEPRIAAKASGDPDMLAAYLRREDPYIGLGLDMGFDKEKVLTKEPNTRRVVKAAFLGWMYGARGPKLVETVAKQNVKISLAEAEASIRKLEQSRPRFVRWRQEIIDRARQEGAAYSLHGRRRLLPMIYSKDPTYKAEAEREAVNEVMQGTAADIIKAAMPKVHRIIKAAGGRMVNQVHDEIVGTWPEEAERDLGPVLDAIMVENELDIPLRVESEHGYSWGSAKPH